MTSEEEEELFAAVAVMSDMLKQVQTTVLANQTVLMAHLATERLARGDAWMEELRGSASATLADVLLEYGPLAHDVSVRTKQILDSIANARTMTANENH